MSRIFIKQFKFYTAVFHVEFRFKLFDKMVNKRDFLKIINLYTVKKMSKDEMEALHDLKSTLKKNVQDSIEVIFQIIVFFCFFFKIVLCFISLGHC